MRYILNVQRTEPLTDEEKSNRSRMGRSFPTSSDAIYDYDNEKILQVLNVTVTEDEWSKIKKAVIAEVH